MKRSHPTTELMETQFGPVLAEVLKQTDDRREVLVKSGHTGQVFEHAAVEFDPTGVAAYPEVHRRIRAGALIGEAFRGAGIPFERAEQSPESVELTDAQRGFFGTDHTHGRRITADILVGPERVRYAHNVETYSPALNWPE